MSRPPRIGVIGGVDRCTALLERTAETLGCRLEHHSGRTSGPKSSELDALVARVDLVIILTDTNSHGAVGKARKLAQVYNRKHVLARRISPNRLRSLISSSVS